MDEENGEIIGRKMAVEYARGVVRFRSVPLGGRHVIAIASGSTLALFL